MELLLNVAWVLMVLPAYWLWRKRAPHDPREAAFTAVQCLMALGCVLILLFPVISATDDLHAMRCEIEEPGVNKRAVKAGNDKGSASVSRPQAPPAMAVDMHWLNPLTTGVHQVYAVSFEPLTAPRFSRSERAPPISFLG